MALSFLSDLRTSPSFNSGSTGAAGVVSTAGAWVKAAALPVLFLLVKEEVVFDKESSRLHVRILGVAPLKTIKNTDGSFRAVTPLFWVYYPDMRPLLARYEAYNGKNFGARMSWEELFESRMFASRIIKSTLDNPGDQFIEAFIKDPILRLLEGDAVKERIFNYEQDLWSY